MICFLCTHFAYNGVISKAPNYVFLYFTVKVGYNYTEYTVPHDNLVTFFSGIILFASALSFLLVGKSVIHFPVLPLTFCLATIF